MMPVFFQAIGGGASSVLLSLTRQIFCLIPIFWLLSKLGLRYTWLAFPVSELITGGLGTVLYMRQLRIWGPLEVTVGGAVIFVAAVERFEKAQRRGLPSCWRWMWH